MALFYSVPIGVRPPTTLHNVIDKTFKATFRGGEVFFQSAAVKARANFYGTIFDEVGKLMERQHGIGSYGDGLPNR